MCCIVAVWMSYDVSKLDALDRAEHWSDQMQIKTVKGEFVTVMVTPYQTARGRLVSFVPQSNSAIIDVNGQLVRGECLSSIHDASDVVPQLACA